MLKPDIGIELFGHRMLFHALQGYKYDIGCSGTELQLEGDILTIQYKMDNE